MGEACWVKTVGISASPVSLKQHLFRTSFSFSINSYCVKYAHKSCIIKAKNMLSTFDPYEAFDPFSFKLLFFLISDNLEMKHSRTTFKKFWFIYVVAGMMTGLG